MINQGYLYVHHLGARIAEAIYFDHIAHTLYIIVLSPITPPFRCASVSLTTGAIDAVSVIHLPASHLLRAHIIHPRCHVSELSLSRIRFSKPTRCPVVILLRAQFS